MLKIIASFHKCHKSNRGNTNFTLLEKCFSITFSAAQEKVFRIPTHYKQYQHLQKLYLSIPVPRSNTRPPKRGAPHCSRSTVLEQGFQTRDDGIHCRHRTASVSTIRSWSLEVRAKAFRGEGAKMSGAALLE